MDSYTDHEPAQQGVTAGDNYRPRDAADPATLDRSLRGDIPSMSVRVAMIGCGAVAERGHLPTLAASSEARLSWLVDNNEARTSALAARFGAGSRTSPDYRDVIGHTDAAIVALPHSLHGPVCSDLLAHGIHVLVEKPMAMSTGECDQMM